MEINGNNVSFNVPCFVNDQYIEDMQIPINTVKFLDLSNAHVNISGIGNLTNLEGLNLNNTQIVDISEIGRLTNLKVLYLENNQIVDISGIRNLTNLEGLELSNNQITNLEIGNLTNLTYLSLNHNQLTHIHASIGRLTRLEQLSLNDNQIRQLPAMIGNLTALEVLELSNNQLTHIPRTIGNLTNLVFLKLDNNQLAYLPASIGNLTELKFLIYDDPITLRPLQKEYFFTGYILNKIKEIFDLNTYNQLMDRNRKRRNKTEKKMLHSYSNASTAYYKKNPTRRDSAKVVAKSEFWNRHIGSFLGDREEYRTIDEVFP